MKERKALYGECTLVLVVWSTKTIMSNSCSQWIITCNVHNIAINVKVFLVIDYQ